MENVKEKVEELTSHVKGYADTFIELAQVKLAQKAADTTASAVIGIAIFVFTLLVLILGGIAIGWWLGTLLNNIAAGFFIITGFYLLCLLFVFLAGKKTIIPMVRNMIVKKIYE